MIHLLQIKEELTSEIADANVNIVHVIHLLQIKEELTSEKDKEMKKVHTEMKDSARGDIREEMKREFEETFNSEVEAKVRIEI